MPEIVRAALVLTMDPARPRLEDGGVFTDGGRILDVGPWRELSARHAAPTRNLGDTVLAPGLVNAHAHLELSHMRGTTVRGQGFAAWVDSLLAGPCYEFDPHAVRAAAREMRDCGTATVADTATRAAPDVADILQGAGLGGVVFSEAIGFPGAAKPAAAEYPEQCHGPVRRSVSGHALTTTAPEVLRAAKAHTAARGLPFSLHLAEHEDEEAALLRGEGALCAMLAEAGRLPAGWKAPGVRPVPLAVRLGLLDAGTMAVHCVRLDAADIATLAESGATACLCPRSNAYITGERAPWERLLGAGVPCCLGTDSAASNDDLDLTAELAYFVAGYEGALSAEAALALVTTIPARTLGLEGAYGRIAPGMRAAFCELPRPLAEALGC